MDFYDLRAYLDKVGDISELTTVLGADTATDIGPITEITAWSPDHPMILFDEIPGYAKGWRIAIHAADSYKRMQLLYGFPEGMRGRQLVSWWKEKLDDYKAFPPEEVATGPVMENVQTGDDIDLWQFPAPLWHAEDAGPYLATGGASVLRDPDNGRLNVGCYRGMVYDRNTLGHHFAGGHHGQIIRDKYFERGENCPVVVTLGNDPSFTLAGAENLPSNMSEMEYGGFLRGVPYEVIRGPITGLPFPASAEVVLEGEVLNPDVEPKRLEGPWGEALGYYAAAYAQPAIRIKAIYHRNSPIILGQPTLRFQNRGSAGGFTTAARRWHMLERSGLEGIKGVGQVGPFMVISIRQAYSGHVMQVADYAMSGMGDRPPRYLVIVDDDIDPTNQRLVQWAISTRVDPASQVHIQGGRWASAVNPAGLTPEKRMIEDYTVGTMIIDACRPYQWRHNWDKMFKLSDIGEDLRLQMAAKWSSVIGPIMNEPKPI